MIEASRLFATADRRRLVRIESGGFQILEWSGRVELSGSGPLALDLAQAMPGGALDPRTRARLEAMGCVLSEPLSEVAPADLLRRDGYSLLFLELLARCNERCRHCYAGSHPGASEALESLTVAAVLGEARELGFESVQLTGGDPLLSPIIVEAAIRARELGLAIEVFTNGLALGRELLAELRRLEVSFAFSLYADRAPEHEAVTGVPGSWDRTTDAIRRAREAGAAVRIGVVLMEPNASRGEETIRFARALAGEGAVSCDVERSVGRGTFDPTRAIPQGALRGGHRKSRRRGSGKACVAADGRVHPCIFARWIELGRVGPEGGLRAALTRPKGPVADQASRDGAERLACRECRLAARELARRSRAHEVPDAAPTPA